MDATILSLTKAVELDLRLMLGNRCVLGTQYSVPLLIDRLDNSKGFSIRLKVIAVVPVLDIDLEVLVAAPQDGG